MTSSSALFQAPDRSIDLPVERTNLRLKDILKTLPRECFQKDTRKAWSTVVLNILLVGLGYVGLALAPWFLLPFLWIFTGTSLTGFFVIAHDCGHRSFAKRRWVNDLLGQTMLLPLIYPFHSWRILHNCHHAHTNKMDVDNAWQPFRPEFYDSLGQLGRWGYQMFRGRFWWIASVLHWAVMHFDWNRFEGKQRSEVKQSVIAVSVFAAVVLPLLLVTTGPWGLVKFWLLPWMVYHFWMSTFTLVHHTAPDVPFQPASTWDEATAQLSGTVHCDYPLAVEFLCHHINVHIPHHISTAIPSYNLRLAHESLKQNWGSYLYECRFSWELMRTITDRCHLYNPDHCYDSCSEYSLRNRNS